MRSKTIYELYLDIKRLIQNLDNDILAIEQANGIIIGTISNFMSIEYAEFGYKSTIKIKHTDSDFILVTHGLTTGDLTLFGNISPSMAISRLCNLNIQNIEYILYILINNEFDKMKVVKMIYAKYMNDDKSLLSNYLNSMCRQYKLNEILENT